MVSRYLARNMYDLPVAKFLSVGVPAGNITINIKVKFPLYCERPIKAVAVD